MGLNQDCTYMLIQFRLEMIKINKYGHTGTDMDTLRDYSRDIIPSLAGLFRGHNT